MNIYVDEEFHSSENISQLINNVEQLLNETKELLTKVEIQLNVIDKIIEKLKE